jgi:hypothetical protein
MSNESAEQSSPQWFAYTELGQYNYAEGDWFSEIGFATFDQAEAFLDGPANDFLGSRSRRDNGWHGPIEVQMLSDRHELFKGPWLRDVLTISKTDKNETFEQTFEVEWKMTAADAIPHVVNGMEREGLLPKSHGLAISKAQRKLVQGRTDKYRLPELECALDEGWSFFEIEMDARQRLGHLNPNDAAGYEFRLFSAALDLEDSLRSQHSRLTAIDVCHFWTSLQVRVSLAAFCRSTLWIPQSDQRDIEAARRLFFRKLGGYVHGIHPERRALSNRRLVETTIRRKRTSDPNVQRIKYQVRKLRKEGLDYKSICDRLGAYDRPPRATWRDSSWPMAYKRHTAAVTKWLSEACS